jgi:hypothetical protein
LESRPSVTPRNYALAGFDFNIQTANNEDLSLFHWVRDLKVGPRTKSLIKRAIKSPKYSFRLERSFNYSDFGGLTSELTFVQGYWQSPKYFAGVAEDLRSYMPPNVSETGRQYELMLERVSEGNNLCVNVRRGDFANNDGNNFHGLMGVDYYNKATRLLRDKHNVDRIFVFSDDPEWCRENLTLDPGQIVVGHEFAGTEFVSYLHLMAACKLFVIPNSTFGWWAAWLAGEKALEVVAPLNWFRDSSISTADLFPDTWTRV